MRIAPLYSVSNPLVWLDLTVSVNGKKHVPFSNCLYVAGPVPAALHSGENVVFLSVLLGIMDLKGKKMRAEGHSAALASGYEK